MTYAITRLALAALALPLVPLSASCSCSLIYVQSGLTVELAPTAPLPDGTYQIVTRVDGLELVHSLTLPAVGAPSCEPGWSGCRLRAGTGDRALYVDASLERSVGIVVVAYEREDLAPSDIALEVRRDGVVLAAQAYHPRYVSDEPNGWNCGEVRRADDQLVIPVATP